MRPRPGSSTSDFSVVKIDHRPDQAWKNLKTGPDDGLTSEETLIFQLWLGSYIYIYSASPVARYRVSVAFRSQGKVPPCLPCLS